MRKPAGFAGTNKFYFNTRTDVIPSDELLVQTPMGSWVYTAFEGVQERANGGHQTALHVLRFLCELNKVLVQDAAAMLVLSPDRASHPMFEMLPVFKTEAFEVTSRQSSVGEPPKCPSLH
jgi:hypothetical protein